MPIDASRETIKRDLGQRTFAGSIWLFTLRVSQQGVTLVQLTVLGRLLNPDDFGLMGIASLATQALAVFVYTGYEYALVQRMELREEDIHTAWWVMLGRRLLIGIALVLLAYPIAQFYRAPDAIPILVAMGAAQCVVGLTSPAASLMQRDLQYRRLFNYYIWSGLVGLLVGITATFLLRNVWALVLGAWSSSVAQVVLSYHLHPYRPRWCFSMQSFRQLSSYGKWMLGSAILWFAFSQGANAFSGWMFGVAALGSYQMASRFALLPSTQIGEVIVGTAFPAYSLIQDDVSRVSKAFLRVLSLSGLFVFGLTALLALALPGLLVLILGEKWNQAAALVPVIAVAGGVMAMLRTASPLYLAIGRPHHQFAMDLVQTAVMLCLLYPLGNRFGIIGLPFATLAGAVSAIPIWWFCVRSATDCTFREVGAVLLPPFVGVIVIILVFQFGQLPVFPANGAVLAIVWQFTLIFLAMTGFAFMVWVMQRILPGYEPLTDLRRNLLQGLARLSG